MIIGADIRLYLKQIKLSSDDETAFFQSVMNYFMIACDYIIKKLPVNDPLLQHAEVADISWTSFQCYIYPMTTMAKIKLKSNFLIIKLRSCQLTL